MLASDRRVVQPRCWSRQVIVPLLPLPCLSVPPVTYRQQRLYDKQEPLFDVSVTTPPHRAAVAMSTSKPASASGSAQPPPGSRPRIPETYIEIPDQRRYAVSLGVLCLVRDPIYLTHTPERFDHGILPIGPQRCFECRNAPALLTVLIP